MGYGYYSMGMPTPNQSENKQNAQLSLSTSTMPAMWDLHNAQMQQLPPMPPKQEVNGNSDVLVPKQEPIYDEQMQQYLNQTAAGVTASSYDPLQAMPDFMNTMNTMNSMMPYYPPPNMNYLNYENQHLLYSGNHNQMLQDPNNMNHQIEKKIEVPPLPPQLMDNEEEALYEINK